MSDDIDTANSSTTIVTEGGTVHSTPTTENAEKRVSGRLSDPIVARIIQATDAPSKAEGHALEYDPALERGL